MVANCLFIYFNEFVLSVFLPNKSCSPSCDLQRVAHVALTDAKGDLSKETRETTHLVRISISDYRLLFFVFRRLKVSLIRRHSSGFDCHHKLLLFIRNNID